MTTLDAAGDPALGARRAFFGPLTRLLNPTIRRLAGRSMLPMVGLVHHYGRRSGRTYATPVAIGYTGTAFFIPLTFGSSSDWVRNILASGDASVTWRGREYAVDDPVLVDDVSVPSELSGAFNLVLRLMLKAMGTHRFLRLQTTPSPPSRKSKSAP